jgi:hypothetical protein
MKINGHLEFHTPSAATSDGQIKNAIIEVASAAPGTGAVRGRIYYNDGSVTSGDKGYWYHDGITWVKFASGGNTANLQNEIDAIELTIGDMINSDGTANTANMNALTNVTGANDLSDVLTQLDAAISGQNELSELDDVTITAATNGDILYYDNGDWVNAAPGATSGVQPYDAGLANLATGGTGIVVMDGDTVTYVSIAASTANDKLGVQVTANANGTTGNPTIGLDIVGRTALAEAPASDDSLMIYDLSATTNKKVTIANLADGVIATGIELGDLSDVTDALSGSLVTSDKYFFNATGASAYEVTAATLGALNNVAAGVDTATVDDVLAFDGTAWTAITVATMLADGSLEDLGDVAYVGSPAPVDGQVLQFNSVSGNWENASLTGVGAAQPYDAGLAALAAAGTGIVSMNGDDVYFRTLTASSAASEEGIIVTNGQGVAGNPTVGLDIDGLTDGGVPGTGEKLVVFDGANNVTATVAQLTDGIIASGITLGDLSDVDDLVSHTAGTAVLLVGDGTNYDTIEITKDAPANFVEAVEDIVAELIVSQTLGSPLVDHGDITVVYDDGARTLTFSVDDSYLRNDGDTLDSGVLTVASGAQITVATGGKLVITDDPVNPTDAVNKRYVDEIAEGLSTRQSVTAASTTNLVGTFTAGSGSPWVSATLVVASGAPTFDGETLSVGERVLLKDQTNEEENGIWGVASATGSPINGYTLRRCDCTDEDGEVSGAYTFVESGSTYANTGWVLSVDDPATFDIDSDPIHPIQFSGAGAYSGAGAINLDGTVFFTDLSDLTSANPVLADLLVFNDISVTPAGTDGGDRVMTVQSFLDHIDILTSPAGGNPILATDGVQVTTVGNSAQVELNVSGLTDLATASGDEMVFHDVSATGTHIKRTIADFITDHDILTGSGGGGQLSGSDGIIFDATTNTMELNIGGLTPATIVGTDTLVFNDGDTAGVAGTHAKITAANFLAQLNVVNGLTAQGLVAVTTETSGAQVYESRSIVESAVNSLLGIDVVNGDGIAGNPTVGLDIVGRTALGAAPAAGDLFVVYDLDVTTNKSVTMANLAAGVGNNLTLNGLSDVDTAGVATGNVLTYNGSQWVDGTDEWTLAASAGTNSAIGLGDTVTIAGSAADSDSLAVTTTGNGTGTVTIEVSGAIGNLSDVNTDGLDPFGHGQVLAFVQGNGDFRPRKMYYLHDQGSTSTTWTVAHNIGQRYCNVTVVDASDQVIIPQSITFDNDNQLTVTFNTAVAGKVVVMGLDLSTDS